MKTSAVLIILLLVSGCFHGEKTGGFAPGPHGNSNEAELAIREAVVRTMLVDESLTSYFGTGRTIYVSFLKNIDPPPEFLKRFSEVEVDFAPISKCADRWQAQTLNINNIIWIDETSAKVSATALSGNGGAGYETFAKWSNGKWFVSFPEIELTIN